LYLNFGTASFPGRNGEALKRKFGDVRVALLEDEVVDILGFASAILPTDSLHDLARDVRKAVRTRFPKLDRTAVRAIEWYCTYSWK
jgi:hypothetical protein